MVTNAKGIASDESPYGYDWKTRLMESELLISLGQKPIVVVVGVVPTSTNHNSSESCFELTHLFETSLEWEHFFFLFPNPY